MSFKVFVGILNHGDDDDEAEGHRHDGFAVGDGNPPDALHEGDQQEIAVRHFPELVQQVQGNESHCRVLRRSDFIARILTVRSELLLPFLDQGYDSLHRIKILNNKCGQTGRSQMGSKIAYLC
jgi:hypothetical protein